MVVAPEQLREEKDINIFITSTTYEEEIRKDIRKYGIEPGEVWGWSRIFRSLAEKQYFEPDIMIPEKEESFVDCGCYDGQTDLLFLRWCGGWYDHIYAFEADKSNLALCRKTFVENGLTKVTLIDKGVWNCSGIVQFRGDLIDSGQGSKIVAGEDDNTISIETTTIDEALKGGKVTFIKMDIEGAELNALKGAAETIRTQHPKLAICIYHKKEDIVEIPAYILSLWSGYKLYIRHYRIGINETVLYAV